MKTNNLKKWLIWDLDGTLLNSIGPAIQFFRKMAMLSSLPVPSTDFLVKIWGQRFTTKIVPLVAEKYNWNNNQIKKFLDRWNNFFPKEADKINKPFANVKEVLLACKQLGLHNVIISNRTQIDLIDIFNNSELSSDLFDHLRGHDFCPEEGELVKPNSRVLTSFMTKTGAQPSQIVGIGDSIKNDYELFKSQGIDFIAMTGILHSREDFAKAGVPKDFIVSSPQEIFPILEKHFAVVSSALLAHLLLW